MNALTPLNRITFQMAARGHRCRCAPNAPCLYHAELEAATIWGFSRVDIGAREALGKSAAWWARRHRAR